MPHSRCEIRLALSKVSGYRVDEILGRDRHAAVVRVRQVAAWLMCREGYSTTLAGRALGRDHTTVIHSCRRINAAIAAGDSEISALIRNARAALARRPFDVVPVEGIARPTRMPEPNPEPLAVAVELIEIPPSWIGRARELRRRGATLVGTAKVIGVPPVVIARALGELLRKEMADAA